MGKILYFFEYSKGKNQESYFHTKSESKLTTACVENQYNEKMIHDKASFTVPNEILSLPPNFFIIGKQEAITWGIIQ